MLDELDRAPASLDRRAALRRAIQRSLEIRLEEEVIRLPSGRRRRLGAHGHDRLAVGAEPAVFVDREEIVGDLLDDAERLPDAHDLVVEVDRARQVVEAAEALEDADAVPGAAEQRGRRLTDGPVADYCHVVIELGHRGDPPSTRMERTLQKPFVMSSPIRTIRLWLSERM